MRLYFLTSTHGLVKKGIRFANILLLAAARLQRVLTTDPAVGIFRHLDAGYELAREIAIERKVKSV